MKRIFKTILPIVIIACALTTQCVFADPSASVVFDNNAGCIVVTVEDMLANDQVFIQVFSHTELGRSQEPEFGYIYNADADGNLITEITVPNTTSTLKTVWVKPRVGNLIKLEPVVYYVGSEIDGFKNDWNDAVNEVGSTAKMTEFVKVARNINIVFDTTLGDELSISTQGAETDALVAELKTKGTSNELETIRGYFKASYVDFLLKNLNDRAAAKFVDQLYGEIVSPVEGDVHFDIISKMDNERRILVIEKALLNSDNTVSVADFKKNLYSEAIFDEFKHIQYTNEIMPLIQKYNTDYIGIDMTAYNGLTSPGSVASGLKSAQASIVDFNDLKKKFNALVDIQRKAESDAKDKINRPDSGFSSGGGGGGGILVGIPPIAENEIEVENIKEVNDTIFDDLKNFEWAEEHIMALYNKGVIDGVGNKQFAPADKVTREQAVKMLFSFVNEPEESVESGFTDISDDMWYTKFINNAKSIGIISGKSDNTFGVGEYITRQDMAVMLVNSIKVADVTKIADITMEKMTFGDAEKIDSYAIYAVSVLNKLGIITGDDQDNFNPLDGASRAEAAVMISRVMKLLN